MEEGKLEKIIKPIIGIALICYLTYIGLGALFKGGETVANRMEDRASNARTNKSDPETIKKLEIDLALMKEKLRLETEKVKEQKAKVKELDMEIRRIKSSNYYPREEINKSFTNGGSFKHSKIVEDKTQEQPTTARTLKECAKPNNVFDIEVKECMQGLREPTWINSNN